MTVAHPVSVRQWRAELSLEWKGNQEWIGADFAKTEIEHPSRSVAAFIAASHIRRKRKAG